MNRQSQLNSFNGGMNMDLDYSLLKDNQYIYAENVRVISNGDGSFGVLQGIEGNLESNPSLNLQTGEQIIFTDVIRHLGVMITRVGSITNFYRIDFGSKTDPTVTKIASLTMTLGTPISGVCRWEDENNVKLYFADGVSQMRVINIDSAHDQSNISLTPDDLLMLPSASLPQLTFNSFGSGALESGMVQYAYRLFNPRGSETSISELSKMFHLSKDDTTKSNAEEIIGSPKNDNTGKSIILNATLASTQFTRAYIYRIFYESKNSSPVIQLAADINFNGTVITFEDKGGTVLDELTVDEFNGLTSYTFIPKILETKDNILFAANVIEDTWDVTYDARAYRCTNNGTVQLLSTSGDSAISFNIDDVAYTNVPDSHDCICPYNTNAGEYKYNKTGTSYVFGGRGKNVSYRFVTAQLLEDSTAIDRTSGSTALQNDNFRLSVVGIGATNIQLRSDGNTQLDTMTLRGASPVRNYSNPEIDANLKGYTRDEIYRFGIVFYNDNNIPSPVHWIGDIRMPRLNDSTFDIFETNATLYSSPDGTSNRSLITKPLGLRFTVNNIPSGVRRWEIVRCERTLTDKSILSQGIISGVCEYTPGILAPFPYMSWATRHGYFAETGDSGIGTDGDEYGYWIYDTRSSANNLISNNYAMFVSPEVCINRENSQDMLDRVTSIEPVATLFSDINDSSNQNTNLTKIFANARTIKNSDGTYLDVYARNTWNARNGMVGTTDSWFYLNSEYFYSTILAKYYNKSNETTNTNYISIADAVYSPSTDPYLNSEVAEPELPQNNATPIAIGNSVYYNWTYAQYASGNKTHVVRKLGPHGVCALLQSNGITNSIPTSSGLIDRQLNAVRLCNIRQNVNPYGGNTYSARQNSAYLSTGVTSGTVSNTTVNVFGGDTYIGVLDYAVLHFVLAGDYSLYSSNRTYSGAYIPCESSINLSLRNDNVQTSKTYLTTNGYSNHYVQDDIIQMGTLYTQGVPLYAYNDAYSAEPTAKSFVSASIYNIDNAKLDNRIYASEVKTNNEVTDSWTKFKAANYIDVDSQYGAITNMMNFKNTLFFWQSNSFGVVSVNERSLITDNNPGSLTLGTGDILSRFDYYATKNGIRENQLRCATQSDSTIYWYDADRNELCSFDGDVNSMAKLKGVQSYLNKNKDLITLDPILEYDKKYNEVLVGLQDNILIFNEQIGAFTSFYTINPQWYFGFTDGLTFYNNNKLYVYNGGEQVTLTDGTKQSRIDFVINANYPFTKTFDKVIYPGDFTDGTNFENIIYKTKRQESFIADENYKGYREDTYSIDIPRSNRELNVAQEIVNKSFRDRMKGKYLLSHYEYDGTKDGLFKVPYIETIYRQSFM